ncbi:MAG: hypothetical protein GY716_00090 [bacterium]|nr:hypothetical protein [bacterium]
MKTGNVDSSGRPPNLEPSPRVRPERRGPHQVELILTGGDLLRGYVSDDNAAILTEFFHSRGDTIRRVTILDDDPQALTAAVREALERNPHVIVTTGGLGPGHDDRTLSAVADALGVPLTPHPEARAMVEEAYRRLQRTRVVHSAGIDAVRQKMCRVPIGGVPLVNDGGIAPGMFFRKAGGAFVICLPGKPDEMRTVLKSAVDSSAELSPRGHVARREIEAPDADESRLSELIERLGREHPSVWVSTRPVGAGKKGSRILIVLEAGAAEADEANAAVDAAVNRVLALASGS